MSPEMPREPFLEPDVEGGDAPGPEERTYVEPAYLEPAGGEEGDAPRPESPKKRKVRALASSRSPTPRGSRCSPRCRPSGP